jgi:hypothetical protein
MALVPAGGCGGRKTPANGPQVNGARKAAGIPVIPPIWQVYADLGSQVDWVNPDFRSGKAEGKPVRAMKQIFSSAGRVDREIDYYYSGRKYALPGLPEESDWERLQITFDFGRQKQGQIPWECDVSIGPDRGEHTLAEAEAILKKWGLSRE